MNTVSGCCICDELASSMQDKLFQDLSGIKNRILLENDIFTLLPSVSPIGNGHYLVFTKSHVTASSQLAEEYINALDEFINTALDHMSKRYGEIIIFEHGVAEEQAGGCGINHAHIHLLPTSLKEIIHVKESLDELNAITINSPLKQIKAMCGNKTYLFVGRDTKNIKYYISKHFASQTIRKIICEHRKIDNWDWKKLDNWEMFRNNYVNGVNAFS